jgi:ribosome biogenesis GTPase
MQEGVIVKALSGFYYVEDGQTVRMCRARGVFKKKGITPLVGDHVTFSPIGSREGIIEDVHARRVELMRPPIANVDQALLVFSVKEPELNLWLLDRILVHTERAGLPGVIVLTKVDLLADRETFGPCAAAYERLGYPVVWVSSRTGEGIEEVRAHIQGKISVVTGQSGVGKSTLLNALSPELQLKSAEISHKLGRGRHTTRHVELLRIANQTYVADTPGFSQLEFGEMEPEELADCFRDIRQLRPQCQYRGCLHEAEEGCAVRPAVEEGRMAAWRYENYLEFLAELKDNKERRF